MATILTVVPTNVIVDNQATCPAGGGRLVKISAEYPRPLDVFIGAVRIASFGLCVDVKYNAGVVAVPISLR